MDIHVYAALVASHDDLVGAVAYSLYKQTKVEWIVALKIRNGGNEPTSAEIAMFHDLSVLPTQLQGYRDLAAALAARFLKEATRREVEQLAMEARQSALAGKFETTHQAVATALTAVQRELASKRTWKNWGADVGAALVINGLTLLLVAGLYYGYQHLSALTSVAEQTLQLVPPASSPADHGMLRQDPAIEPKR